MKLQVWFAFALIVFSLSLTGCSSNANDPWVYAQIGETYQFDTWDITVESLAFENELLLNETTPVTAPSGYMFLTFSIQATLIGDEPEVFLPSRADVALGNHAEDGMTMIRGSLDNRLYFRVDRIVADGIVDGNDDWTVANTEAAPGETLSGIVIFQFPAEDIVNEDSNFHITLHQLGSEPILRFDLRDLVAPPAQEYPEEDGVDAVYTPTGVGIHGLLSRVEYGDNVAYLFGTMHIGFPHWFPLAPEVEDALRRADVLALETDLTPETMAAFAEEMMELMMLSDNRTLEDLLPEDVLASFTETLLTYGVDNVGPLTPWAISILVSELVYATVGLSADYGLETYLLDFARENDLSFAWLNPNEHEMYLALNLPDEVQIYAARHLLDLEAAIEDAEALAAAFEAQDTAALLQMVRMEGQEADPFTQYFLDVLIIQRSIEFAQEVIRLLQETDEPTTFFVAMGIGHMIGDDHGNVFVYLQDAGFEIEALYR